MSPEEAEIFLLKQELIQNHHTISFLHNCLTNPAKGFDGGYSYGYPEQTISRLKEIEQFVKIPEGCFHSRFDPECQNCIDSGKTRVKTGFARTVMQQNKTLTFLEWVEVTYGEQLKNKCIEIMEDKTLSEDVVLGMAMTQLSTKMED